MTKLTKLPLLQGTLDLLVLRVLAAGPMHGWGIADRLAQLSEQALELGEGTLYPALYRMEARGWIRAEWALSDHNRKAKYYALTRAGRRQLEEESAHWERFAAVMTRVLQQA